MTYQGDFTLPTELLEQIAAQGFDKLPDLIQVVINAAMQAERQQYLGAAPYGAGRTRVNDAVDHAVGAVVLAAPGTRVAAGEPVLELHYRAETSLTEALELAARAIEVSDAPVPALALILGEVT